MKKMTAEGRVYIDFPQVINKDTYTREILDYVQAIRDCVSDPWRDEIDDLWQEILDEIRNFSDDYDYTLLDE